MELYPLTMCYFIERTQKCTKLFFNHYIVGNHSNKGAANNALDVLSGQAAGVNVTSNGLDRMTMLNSVRVRGTTSIPQRCLDLNKKLKQNKGYE